MINDRPMFSVVVIADKTEYNAMETISSTLVQTYAPLELIYIDNTAQAPGMAEVAGIIRQHRKQNLQSVYLENNISVKSYPELCRQAWLLATGRFVVLLQAGMSFCNENVLEKIAYNLQHQWRRKKCVLPPAFWAGQPMRCFGNMAYVPVLRKNNHDTVDMMLKPATHIVPQVFSTCFSAEQHKEALVEEEALFQWSGEKMNFSSGRRLLKLCKHIENATINCNSVLNMVRNLHEAQLQIYNRAVGSLWGISRSDKVVLYFIKILSDLLYAFRPGEEDALKAGARQFAVQVACETESTAKVVFFAQEFSVWPSLDSAYKACAADERFTAQAVYVPFNMRLENGLVPETLLHPYWRSNVPIMPYTMYNIAAESPDVAVFLKPYDLIPEAFSVNQVEKVTERLVFMPYGMRAAVEPEFYDYIFQLPLSAASWRVVGGNKSYDELAAKLGMRRGQNLANCAHPRVDAVRENVANEVWPESWKPRLPGKKVLLYNTNALVEPIIGSSTFFMYHKELFRYFASQDEMQLVWRPHPRLQRKTCELGLMTEAEWQQLYQELEVTPNIIVDRQESYLPALRLADALITDISSLLLEFYFLDRPALLLLNGSSANQIVYGEFSVCEIARTFEDISRFCRQVLQAGDACKEKRRAFLKSMLHPIHVTAGEDIMNMIYEGLQSTGEL